MSRVLLLEDNSDMALALVKFLSKNGYDVDHFSSFEDAKENVDQYDYDGYILDINLPKASGYDAAKIIRNYDRRSPIIAITARDSVEDKLKGFEYGFNDYVVKPFDLRELLARVNSHIGSIRDEEESVTVGDLVIDKKEYVAKYKGDALKLTRIEFDLLYRLAKSANILVRTDDLIEYAWGSDPDIFDPPVRMHISNLRKKIDDDDLMIIETIPGIGYRLNM